MDVHKDETPRPQMFKFISNNTSPEIISNENYLPTIVPKQSDLSETVRPQQSPVPESMCKECFIVFRNSWRLGPVHVIVLECIQNYNY